MSSTKSMSSTEFDSFQSFKWTSIATCAVFIPYAVVYGFIEVTHLIDWEKHPDNNQPFYRKHITELVYNMVVLAIVSLGIFADFTEKFNNVLIFDVCLSVLLAYQVVVLCLSFSLLGVVSVLPLTFLAAISWLYLNEIKKKERLSNREETASRSVDRSSAN